MAERAPIRVGIIGSGFVARHFVYELERRPRYRLARVLTRRPLDRCPEFPASEVLTDSLDAVIDSSDVVLECTGDAVHAAANVGPALDAGLPVVTLDAEFHVTLGSHFVDRGWLSECAGDQPGSIAQLAEDVVAMGFEPLAYVNMKAFLNRDPTPEEMSHWARRQGYSLPMVTSFTDGTKLQIEQCLVANGLGAGIAREELIGPETADLQEAARILGAVAEQAGHPISDYILGRDLPHGVFVVARHDPREAVALRNLKLGEGPHYVLTHGHCLVHLEVFKTIQRMLEGRRPLLNNGPVPRVSVATVAKRSLRPGEVIARGAGSFDVRGVCVNIRDRPGHLPICLANDMRLRQAVEPGQMITFDDVELEDSAALTIWRAIERGALDGEKTHTARLAGEHVHGGGRASDGGLGAGEPMVARRS